MSEAAPEERADSIELFFFPGWAALIPTATPQVASASAKTRKLFNIAPRYIRLATLTRPPLAGALAKVAAPFVNLVIDEIPCGNKGCANKTSDLRAFEHVFGGAPVPGAANLGLQRGF